MSLNEVVKVHALDLHLDNVWFKAWPITSKVFGSFP
jgi:hypothetical protein